MKTKARPAYDKNEVTKFIIDRFKHPSEELSFLKAGDNDGAGWAERTRAEVKKMLMYDPPGAPLDPVVTEEIKFDGYTRRKVYYMAEPNCKCSAYLLVPDKLNGPAPAIAALHDHSGWFYYGKEKIVEHKETEDFMQYIQKSSYGGRGFASELARRGYVVAVPDALGWGERGPANESWLVGGLYDMLSMKKDLPAYIFNYDQIAAEKFDHMCKHILYAGYTYLGVLAQNDMKCVDLLCASPEVDKTRIGCAGLSMGGLRTTLMMAMDARVRCGVPVGFPALYPYSLPQHGMSAWLSAGELWQRLPFPDFAALAMPRELLILYCENDQLFELASMHRSVNTTTAAYVKAGIPGRCSSKSFTVGHQFDYDMQEYAFEWLDVRLK